MGNNTKVSGNTELAENVITMTKDELDEVRMQGMREGRDAYREGVLGGMAIACGLILVGGIVWGVTELIGVFKHKKTDTEEVQPDSEEK